MANRSDSDPSNYTARARMRSSGGTDRLIEQEVNATEPRQVADTSESNECMQSWIRDLNDENEALAGANSDMQNQIASLADANRELQSSRDRSDRKARFATACACGAAGLSIFSLCGNLSSARAYSEAVQNYSVAVQAYEAATRSVTAAQVEERTLDMANDAWTLPGNIPDSGQQCACWVRVSRSESTPTSEQETKAES
jgi:hypothetical protein